MEITIDERYDGTVLRSYLKTTLGLSVKMLSHLKNDEMGIVVNGHRVTVRYILHTGDVLLLADRDRVSGHAVPARLPVEILYEDGDVLVVNKPVNMPTHPSHGHLDDTLANALVYHYREKGIPFVFRPISRLDRNTSGAVLIAKHKIAAARLDAAMRERKIEKTYLALLSGRLTPVAGRIEGYICRTDLSIITRRVCRADEEGAAYALTDYEVVRGNDLVTLVRAFPRTGRTHQLRVHFASLGFPLLGDDLYGSASDLIDRQALHATTICFPHPMEGRMMRVEAPIPEDMSAVLNVLRLTPSDTDAI